MEITLPQVKSKASTDLSDYSILMYGEEKIGKTTFAAQFPEAIFLMCEPGSKALEVYQRPINSWADMKAYLKLLSKDTKFKTIVIDTVDIAYLLCERATCVALGVEDIQDADFGKGWRKVAAEFSTWMNYAAKLGKGVIFISHAKEKSIKNRAGDEHHRTVPTMDRRASDIMEAMVDIWVYYKYNRNGTRTLQIRGTEEIAAGVRTPKNFIGISEIPGGKTPEEAYKNFVGAFNNAPRPVAVVNQSLSMKLKIK